MMPASDVLEILDVLRQGEVPCWVDGGWGVDVLLGRQSREHDDLDVVMELVRVPQAGSALARLGFVLAEDYLPTRAVFRSATRQVDVHPVSFDSDGTGWQKNAAPGGGDCIYPRSGLVTGTIGGVEVPCLSPDLQLAHHLGYQPLAHDHQDMARLADAFGLHLPPPYSN